MVKLLIWLTSPQHFWLKRVPSSKGPNSATTANAVLGSLSLDALAVLLNTGESRFSYWVSELKIRGAQKGDDLDIDIIKSVVLLCSLILSGYRTTLHIHQRSANQDVQNSKVNPSKLVTHVPRIGDAIIPTTGTARRARFRMATPTMPARAEGPYLQVQYCKTKFQAFISEISRIEELAKSNKRLPLLAACKVHSRTSLERFLGESVQTKNSSYEASEFKYVVLI